MAGHEKRKASSDASERGKAGVAKKAHIDIASIDRAAAADQKSQSQHTDTEAAYLDWMRSVGVKLHGVGIGMFPTTGRGCVALKDLQPGDVVVEVPEDAILTVENCVASEELKAFFGSDEDSGHPTPKAPRLDREALVLAVMTEISRGNDSRVALYLTALPSLRATHLPLAWNADELDELEGTSCLQKMYTEDEHAELPSMTAEHWKLVAMPFFEEHPEFAVKVRGKNAGKNSNSESDSSTLKKAYLHAAALVAGFSFTLGEADEVNFEGCVAVDDDAEHVHEEPHTSTQAMVPFWDMLNHVAPEQASVRLEYDEDKKLLKMIMTKEIKKNQQVYNSYGALGDDELLRRYGFVLGVDNPHGGNAEVTLREIVAAAATARFVVEDSYEDDGELIGDDSSDSDDFDAPNMPSTSDSEEEDLSDEDDSEFTSNDDDDSDIDEFLSYNSSEGRFGTISKKETLERLRLLKRFGVAKNSTDRFTVSRTGKPSLALRAAVRILSMHTAQFQKLLAADSYERGNVLDQKGYWSDDDDDVFGNFKPVSTECVWDGRGDDDEEGKYLLGLMGLMGLMGRMP